MLYKHFPAIAVVTTLLGAVATSSIANAGERHWHPNHYQDYYGKQRPYRGRPYQYWKQPQYHHDHHDHAGDLGLVIGIVGVVQQLLNPPAPQVIYLQPAPVYQQPVVPQAYQRQPANGMCSREYLEQDGKTGAVHHFYIQEPCGAQVSDRALPPEPEPTPRPRDRGLVVKSF